MSAVEFEQMLLLHLLMWPHDFYFLVGQVWISDWILNIESASALYTQDKLKFAFMYYPFICYWI